MTIFIGEEKIGLCVLGNLIFEEKPFDEKFLKIFLSFYPLIIFWYFLKYFYALKKF